MSLFKKKRDNNNVCEHINSCPIAKDGKCALIKFNSMTMSEIVEFIHQEGNSKELIDHYKKCQHVRKAIS